ncbi:J domain-containing protein [Stenoxybacter acetivorans]|uniref:J domain-containing protein n=1 Tax=Stenoxybacter acetivorans TaxID=422441 RepID=UPI00055F6AEB|nr:tetratricopeptide repeat protein [Stenoxybacter acetivorans]
MVNLYAILGLEPHASNSEVKQAIAAAESSRRFTSAQLQKIRATLLQTETRQKYNTALFQAHPELKSKNKAKSNTAKQPRHIEQPEKWRNKKYFWRILSVLLLCLVGSYWFTASADLSPEPTVNNGTNITINNPDFEVAETAQNAGNHSIAEAHYHALLLLAKDDLDKGNFDKAFAALHRLSKIGHPESLSFLAEYYLHAVCAGGIILNTTTIELVKPYFLHKAKSNDPKALLGLGTLYMGAGISSTSEQNFELAEQYLLQAAEKGETRAWTQLAMLKGKNGYTTEHSIQAVKHYLAKGEQQGEASALYQLGNNYLYAHYSRSNVWEHDETKGLQYMRQAAAKAHPGALYELGIRYYHQQLTNKNQAYGLQQIQQACKQGHTRARMFLQQIKIKQSIELNKIKESPCS